MRYPSWTELLATWALSLLLGVGLAVLALVLGGCDIPTRAEVREDCEEQVDKALAKVDEVLAECRARADEASQLCTSEIEDVKDWIREEAEAQAVAAGCSRNDAGAWHCPCQSRIRDAGP